MRRLGLHGSTAVGGLSCAGIVIAHSVAYRLVSGGGSHESHLLESTGHGRWPYIVAVAFGLLLAGLLHFGAGIFFARGSRRGKPITFGPTFLRLVVLQSGGFLLLETAERMLSGLGADHLLAEPAITIGLALQAAVALLGSLILLAFVQAIECLAAVMGNTYRRNSPLSFPIVPTPARSTQRVGTCGWSLRGPPSSNA